MEPACPVGRREFYFETQLNKSSASVFFATLRLTPRPTPKALADGWPLKLQQHADSVTP